MGEGLDLSGSIDYSVNVHGDGYNKFVQGVNFLEAASLTGVTTTYGGNPSGSAWYGTSPEYGTSTDDMVLKAVMYEFVASDSVANVVLTNGTSAIIGAVTLEDVTQPIRGTVIMVH